MSALIKECYVTVVNIIKEEVIMNQEEHILLTLIDGLNQ
jgi:hypothetical protein